MATAASLTTSPRQSTGVARTLGLLLHRAVSGALAGAIAGLVAGLGVRLAMRVTAIMATGAEQGTITDAEETVGRISLEGSLFLIIVGGGGFGILGGLVFAAMTRWFAGAGRWAGPLFGAFLLATLGWAVIEGDNRDFATLGAVTVNLAMYVAVFLAYGVVVAPAFGALARLLPAPALRPAFLAALPVYALGLLLVAGIIGITAAAFFEDGAERPLYIIVPVYLVAVTALAGALIARRPHGFERLSSLRGDTASMTAALAVIALPVALGLGLNAHALISILRDAY